MRVDDAAHAPRQAGETKDPASDARRPPGVPPAGRRNSRCPPSHSEGGRGCHFFGIVLSRPPPAPPPSRGQAGRGPACARSWSAPSSQVTGKLLCQFQHRRTVAGSKGQIHSSDDLLVTAWIADIGVRCIEQGRRRGPQQNPCRSQDVLTPVKGHRFEQGYAGQLRVCLHSVKYAAYGDIAHAFIDLVQREPRLPFWSLPQTPPGSDRV